MAEKTSLKFDPFNGRIIISNPKPSLLTWTPKPSPLASIEKEALDCKSNETALEIFKSLKEKNLDLSKVALSFYTLDLSGVGKVIEMPLKDADELIGSAYSGVHWKLQGLTWDKI